MKIKVKNTKLGLCVAVGIVSVLFGCSEPEKLTCIEGEINKDGLCIYTPSKSSIPLVSCAEGQSFNGSECTSADDS
jgi:hypothetical protein